MNKWDIIIGEKYRLDYPSKKDLICKVISMDQWGDCNIIFLNGKKDCYHCTNLKKF